MKLRMLMLDEVGFRIEGIWKTETIIYFTQTSCFKERGKKIRTRQGTTRNMFTDPYPQGTFH